ncbi:MAG TPA: hypothetical protein VGI82_08870 [Chitinophagaceae bacterium]
MDIKRNDATANRPEGDRVLDAPFVFMDIEGYIDQIKEEDAWDKNDRNGITLFKTANVTTVLTCLHKGAVIKDNVVNGLFEIQVLDGKIRVTTDAGDTEMKQGQIIVFHPELRHTIEASKKSTLLLQTIIVQQH